MLFSIYLLTVEPVTRLLYEYVGFLRKKYRVIHK